MNLFSLYLESLYMHSLFAFLLEIVNHLVCFIVSFSNPCLLFPAPNNYFSFNVFISERIS